MTRQAFLIAALLAAPVALPAQAQDPLVTRTPQDSTQRRICRAVNRIGSRLARTVTCKTQAEWDELAAESRRSADRIQRVTSACMMGPNAPGQAHVVCSN
ncbi:MAG: hypothetical protein QOH47_264 [Sphingomonadales bacterium]|nr:hypothetical protein [Sphingomonadales bacterium]